MRKVLVTGATGFIGNHVIEELRKYDVDIIATSLNIEKAREQKWFHHVKYVPLDLTQFDPVINYYSYFDAPDILIHLAWKGLPNYNALFHIEENLWNDYFFIKNLISNGLHNINITGTCFEYGIAEGELSEEQAPSPQNPYSVAKNSLRLFIENLRLHYSFNFNWLRLFYLYGMGQNPGSVIPSLLKAIEDGADSFNMSNGDQVRDYLPVEEAARFIVTVSMQERNLGVINCCSGKPVVLKEFISHFLEERKLKIKLNLGHYPYSTNEGFAFWGSDKKLKKICSNVDRF